MFPNIAHHWYETDRSNPTLRKISACCKDKPTVADDLVTQRVKVSASVIPTYI